MKKYFIILMGAILAIGTSQLALAGEHGGKEHGGEASAPAVQEHAGKTHAQEHGGKEHGGTTAKVPSKDEIRAAMKSYVEAESKKSGTFDIKDPDTGKTLNLELLKVHERVGKTGHYYYSCADFKDTTTSKMYDLDLDVKVKGDNLKVVDVRVHKEDGEARYTYDEYDNRIPLKEGTKSHLGKGSHKGSMKGHSEQEHGGEASAPAAQEHGGKEHGGK